MWPRSRARRAAWALAALAAALCARAPDAQARRRKPYWMISFVGGVLVPVGETADQRDLGLGVGLRVGYTSKIGLGLALAAEYSPLPVVEGGAEADVVTENHFIAAALLPRYTIGTGAFRVTLGAGGGGIMEQTRSRPADGGLIAILPPG